MTSAAILYLSPVVACCQPRWQQYWQQRGTGGEGVRGRAGVNHRMLSTYLNVVLRAGLVLEQLAERGSSVPVKLIARCHRQG